MPRYCLTIEYDGRGYVGWQRQANGLGVQQIIEEAILAFSGESARLFCAGRTDAGVHARGQVAHFDLKRTDVTANTVRDALNYHTKPHAISVTYSQHVADDFHARFSATEREYLYVILNRRARPSLDLGHVWWLPVPLDDKAMHNAAQVLVGKHDFTSFRSSICQADSPYKTLDELSIVRQNDYINIKVRARSFLHHQVRNFVGSLVLVGDGKWTKADLKRALEACDRTKSGQKAPSEGLCLMRVGYEPREAS